jgi:hypothetical protein
MAACRTPGATCITNSGRLDAGTLSLQWTPAPASTGTQAAALQRPLAERLAETLRRAASRLPTETGAALLSLVSPTALATAALVLGTWAASHAVGIGEALDLILLASGIAMVGWQAVDGLKHLAQCVQGVVSASADQDLDAAADHLAQAVTALGVAAVSALLLRGAVRVRQGGFHEPAIKGDPALPPGEGWTNKYGDITYSTAGSATDRALVLYHEQVHSALSPKLLRCREMRADLGMAGYQRSALLRYLEEALAESYAQLRVHGVRGLPAGIRFPVANGYVTLSAVLKEAVVAGGLGSITVAGIIYAVNFEPSAP